MRVGIGILPEDGWQEAQRKWRAVEEYGFDHAWTLDHLGWRALVGEPWFSAVPTLALAATVTERIGLGTLVASPNFRHPVSFAREVISLDDASRGRLLLGIGAAPGGVYDTEVFGAEELTAGQRVRRYGEFVEALDGLLSTDHFDYRGEFYTVVDARNRPGCVQHPRVPFLLAAGGPRALRVVARHGQGWVSNGVRETESMQEWWASVTKQVAQFDGVLEKEGRPADEVDRYLSLAATPTYQLSSLEGFRDTLGRAEELGFTDVIDYWPRAAEPYAGDESTLERVAAEVLPGR